MSHKEYRLLLYLTATLIFLQSPSSSDAKSDSRRDIQKFYCDKDNQDSLLMLTTCCPVDLHNLIKILI